MSENSVFSLEKYIKIIKKRNAGQEHLNCVESCIVKKAIFSADNSTRVEVDCNYCGKHDYFTENFEKNTLTTCLACAYGIRSKALDPEVLKNHPNEKWLWQRFWIKHCINTENDFLFSLLEQAPGEHITREGDILKIITQSGFLHCESEREPVVSMGKNIGKATLDSYRKAIEDWFLRRYNWIDAINVKRGKIAGKASYILSSILIIVVAFMFLCLLWTNMYHFLPWISTLSLIFLISGLFSLLFRFQKFLYARLLMTILVGFTPFIAGSGSWQNAIEIKQANPIIFYLICGLSLIAAFISCSIECKKVASISTRQALSRAFWVTLYGFIFSIAVAILFSMTVGSLYVEDVTANFGFLEFSSVKISIYPAPVILFSSIALFLGIFVNTYSRSEPVTTPF